MRYAYAKMTFHMMLVSFLALILIGCGESGSPGGSSGPGVTASIALSAGVATLSADGLSSTPITAALTDSVGAAVYQQTSVVFRTNLGTFRNGAKEYKVHTADDTGTVIVQLMTTEGITGNAEVWVESNKVKQKIEVKIFDPHKVGTISLRTGSASIKADGVSQVAITATVTDAQGNPEAGAEVKFNTTLGQFYEENPIDPGILNQNTTAVTDVDGEAVVMLISGKTIGTAAILASLNGLNATANVVFTAGEPETISLRAAPSTIRPNGTTNLFAKLKDINGNPVAGQTIVFSQTINASEGTLNSLSAPTNVNGEAQVTYTAGKDPGADIIQAALSNDLDMKATTTIVVDPGAIVIGGITVTAGAPSIVADGIGKVKIRATVTDVDGNPAVGKIVTFTRTAGTLSFTTATTSDIGLAEVTLQATTIAGPATVIAECDGFIGDATVEFIAGPAHHLIMYALPNVVPPNGAFSTAVIIQDQYDNRIDDQRLMLQVRRAGYSEIVDSAEMTPDQAEDGVFRFDWTAATAYGEGNLEITAKVNNGVSKTVTVIVDEGAIIVGSISVKAGAEAIRANGVDSTTIRAIVLDYTNKPAQGITVNFITTLGSLSTSKEVTDQNGIAEIRLTAGTTWGTATVTADANGFKGQTAVRFTSGQAGGVSLTALPSTVKPGGQATIIAEINNGSGAPVAGETLYFNLYDNNTNSVLSSIQGVSDANGRATVTYTGGIIQGTDYIRVTAASDSRITDTTRVTVAVPTGSVGSITLTSAQPSLPADGKTSTAVTATVFDTAGLPMPEGTTITFNTTLGHFPGLVEDPDGIGPNIDQIILTTTDASGKVITSLVAGTVDGLAVVTASVGNVTQAIEISILKDLTGGITLTANPASIAANGTSTSLIRATVKDTGGNPLANINVAFETTLGTLVGATTVKTNASGIAEITLKSSATVGTATVKAMASGFTATATVAFVAGTPDNLTLAASPLIVKPGGTSRLTATLLDTTGNPMAGETIRFNFTDNQSGATLPATPTATTDANGQAFITYTAGTVQPVTDKIQAVSAKDTTVVSNIVEIDVDVDAITVGSITLTANPITIPADEVSSSTITAVVKDSSGNPMPIGTEVVFATNLGTFAGGGTTITVAITGTTGTVATSLIAGDAPGIATVTATVQDLIQSTQVTMTKIDIAEAEYLTLSATKTSIKTNGTDSTTITAIVLDENHVPIEGTTVNFVSDGGMISAGSVVTDANGMAVITLTSGPDKANQTVTVTASVDLQTTFIPITLYGTTITLTPATAQLSIGLTPAATRAIVVKATDADNVPIYNATITFTINAGLTGSTFTGMDNSQVPPVSVPIVSGTTALTTNGAGEIALVLTAGPDAGDVTLTATSPDTSLNTSSPEGTYTLGLPANIFEITSPPLVIDPIPDPDIYEPGPPFSRSANGIAEPVPVIVHAGGLDVGDVVVFTTTFGSWVGGTQTWEYTLLIAGENVTGNLVSSEAGVATVQVYFKENPSIVDSTQISFYNPASKACDIIIDATQTNILPSTGTTDYSLTIEANVVDQNGAPVGDAIVNFYLENTTGGGEYLSPASVKTSPAGIAQTTFTSGTLSTGSDPSSAVKVIAQVAITEPACLPGDPPGYQRDELSIVITGAVANVSIGYATEISSGETNTVYLQPVSVLVADTNGNPISGALVSLSLKPTQFHTGQWVEVAPDEWEIVFSNPCTPPTGPSTFINEDLNNNSILDDSEDEVDRYTVPSPGPGVTPFPNYFDGYAVGDMIPGLNNGMLTPGQSVAGTIPASVATGENGVAVFNLTYQKEYAIWVEDQITATVMVFGTEYITQSRKWLPYATKEEEIIRNAFPESPFNVLPCKAATP